MLMGLIFIRLNFRVQLWKRQKMDVNLEMMTDHTLGQMSFEN